MQRSLKTIKDNIKTVEHKVTVVAVAKTKTVAQINQAVTAGVNNIAENYLQEAIAKIQQLQDLNIVWHFIGSIQSNKCKLIAQYFNWVQTIDSLKKAQKIDSYCTNKTMQVLLQVNIDSENSKSGVEPKQLLDLADSIAKLPNLNLRGIMVIPAPNNSKQAFANSYRLFKQLQTQYGANIDTLSMGMSSDYQLAIASGSNMIRVGSKIFGKREDNC